MKKAPLIALASLMSIAFASGAFAQDNTEPRQDTAPSTAPTGEKAMKAKKSAKKQSGFKEESTAESEGKKADKGPVRKLPGTAPIPDSDSMPWLNHHSSACQRCRSFFEQERGLNG